MREINLIAIHCTASPNGRPLPLETLEREHLRRGFNGIGYHYVIGVDGSVSQTRPLEKLGAHVKGHNANSIGISLVGGLGGPDKLNPGLFTRPQWASLKTLVQTLKAKYPAARICGHRDLSPDLDGDGEVEPHEWLKLCPTFSVLEWLGNGMEPDPKHVLEAK